ncbi:acyltransferase [uncultured Treponema sp.]|uniref:acyltransferase n=1 Tax=uncultured Treponema sp. TaxID=162155 RepID=UPI002595306D|nr:acyltransferase [uncultured Treponema sp.]
MSVNKAKNSLKRSSNFELLRILAMLMIVASHATQHSGSGAWTLITKPFSLNVFATYLFGTYGQTGVILFIIISSWFLCTSNSIHINKAVRLYFQTMISSVLIFLFVKFGDFEPVGIKEFIKALLTPVYSGYWFIRTYLLFYILVPFLQKAVQAADEITHRKLLLVLTIILPVLHFFLPISTEFGSAGDFVYIFIAVSYLKKHEGNFLEKHCRLIFISLLTLMQFSLLGANLFCYHFGFSTEFLKKVLLHIYACHHIFVMLLSMSLFYIFKNYVKIGSSKVINTVAKTTFGVYIFHENPLFCSYGENGLSDKGLLFERWLHIGEHFESDILYPLYFLGCVIFVFACCSMIEFLRQNLCVFVERLCRKYCNRGNCKF